MSEQSPSFPVFGVQPSVMPADETGDPLHIADRDPDELEREVATEHLDPLPPLPSGAAYVLTPGEEVEQFTTGAHVRGPRIVLDADGLALANSTITHDCGTASRLVWVSVKRRPIGAIDRGYHFVVALDNDGQVIARIDTSAALSPMRPDCVEQLCALAGVGFEAVEAADLEELLQTRPELIPPKLEFEVDHPGQEDAREWAMGIGVLVPLSIILGGVAMAAFVAATPFGLLYRLLGDFAVLVACLYVGWSRSKWRARRSLSAPARRRSGRR